MAEPTVITLDTLEALQESAVRLAQNTHHRLTIFTPDLEPALYNTRAFLDAALNLLKRSKHTEIRILTQDTRAASESGHGLLRLLRYTDHQFQIRKLTVDPDNRHIAYLISDHDHLLRRQNARAMQGLCYTDDRARARDQLEEFDLLWNAATTDPNLRSLTL